MILKNNWQKRLTAVTGLLLLLFCSGFTGCQTHKEIVLSPIASEDIIEVKKGDVITAPKDGYFLSKFYFNEIVKAQ